ncbi:MAG: hypothetical protein LUB59_01855 [Candidatus Gastranaerophilales bacterium]|nr:hypothetical protein [Candidatus Gastranaerophilales bacterium]
MAIAAVDGYGDITSSNAKEIYTAYMKGDIDLSASQRVYCEHFLSNDDIEEIEYEVDVQKNSGSSQIEDAENAESHDGQGENVTATTAGNMAAVAAFPLLAMLAIAADGFTAFALGTAAVACSAATIVFTNLFDNGYSDRTQACDNGDDTNSTIDSYTEALEATMESMNDDMESYQEQSETLTVTMNQKTSEMAALQIQLADATAAGDTAGVQSIKEQMQSLEEMDTSEMEDGLSETQENLEAYQAANNESLGVSGAGQTVSDFLKEGTALGAVATVNAVLLAAAAAAAGLTAAGHMPKLAPFFPDFATSMSAKIMYALCAASFGTAATKMSSKASNEFECGSKGGDMQDHVDSLNGMIEEQLAYTEETGESFAETDEESAESQAEAQEAANKAVAANTSSGTDKDKDKDKDKDGAVV